MESIRRKLGRKGSPVFVTRIFAVVHEALADFAIATELADRVFVEKIDWMADAPLDAQRQWIASDGKHGPLTWKRMPVVAKSLASEIKSLGVPIRGHFDNHPAEPDAQAARRA